jgi:hypothetical protein
MTEFGVRDQDSSSEFFFRVTDRLQMESCLTAIVQDSKSVVISSESNELIDHFGAAFVRRIKQKLPQRQLEVFLPRDTDAMLERFNQLLNTLSLDVATQTRNGLGPEKVWVVHDANAMGAHEIQLLTRLIQQFPGAGISVVLMFTHGTAKGDEIAHQNKQFLAWALELPTAEQKLAAIQQARKNKQEEAALEFFNRLSKSYTKKSSGPSVSSAAAASGGAVKSKGSEPKHKGPSTQPNTVTKYFAMMVVVVGLLGLSVGVGFLMNPEVGDEFLAKVGSWVRVTAQPKKETVASEESKAEPIASDSASPAQTHQEAKPNVVELEPKVELNAEPPPQPSSNVNIVAAAEAKAQAVNVITELPEAAVQGRMWLKSLPSDAYVLEHRSFATVKEARAFIKDKEWLVNARITPIFTEGKDDAKFAVMTGHYRSMERARNTIARLKLPTDVTITSVQMAINQAQSGKTKP